MWILVVSAFIIVGIGAVAFALRASNSTRGGHTALAVEGDRGDAPRGRAV